jgi:phenylacetic acid degradation operon negative regulatory protein
VTQENAPDNHFCVRINPLSLLQRRMTDPAVALVARFRRQRPLRGGSLIITVFGDAIALRGGAVTLGSLIELMAPFGLTDRLVRTSVGRLACDDWLVSRRLGRLSEYALSTVGRERFAEATRRIYAGPATRWSGRWTLVLLPGVDAAHRQRVRDALRWEGFGEFEPGVLAHPTVTPAEARGSLTPLGLADLPQFLEATAAHDGGDRRLIESGWDLGDLARRYARFIAAFSPTRLHLEGPRAPSPASAFVIRTLLIHEYRKIHLRDPLLPPTLLPPDWPGTAAYELCRAIYDHVYPAAERHLGTVGKQLTGPLPAPDEALYRRFSGLSRRRSL